MERKAGPFQRVDLSGLESASECCCIFDSDLQPPLISFFKYECVAILLPGARLNTYL